MTHDRGGTLTLHKECYLAVVPADRLEGLTARLRQIGLDDAAVDAFCQAGAEGDWEELSLERIDSGAIRSAVRRVFGFDQVEVERTYVEALEEGRPVLPACVPEEDEGTRAEVEEAFLEHDAHYVHYFGRWRYVEVAQAAERAGQGS